jgi:hypothetical protein
MTRHREYKRPPNWETAGRRREPEPEDGEGLLGLVCVEVREGGCEIAVFCGSKIDPAGLADRAALLLASAPRDEWVLDGDAS